MEFFEPQERRLSLTGVPGSGGGGAAGGQSNKESAANNGGDATGAQKGSAGKNKNENVSSKVEIKEVK